MPESCSSHFASPGACRYIVAATSADGLEQPFAAESFDAVVESVVAVGGCSRLLLGSMSAGDHQTAAPYKRLPFTKYTYTFVAAVETFALAALDLD